MAASVTLDERAVFRSKPKVGCGTDELVVEKT